MAGNATDAPKSSNTLPPNPNSAAGSVDLAILRAEVDDLKKHQPGWVARLGSYAGLIVAGITIIGAAWGAYRWFSSAPGISIFRNPTLEIHYSPRNKRIQLGFAFAIANYGDKDNIVEEITGSIERRLAGNPTSAYIHFSTLDFVCFVDNARVPIPFPLRKSLPSSMSCSASGELLDRARDQILTQSVQTFEVVFRGQGGTQSTISYCFDLPDDAISEISTSKQPMKRRFVYADCEQE